MRRAAQALATVILMAVWVLVLRPNALGGPASYVVVRGSSMLPGMSTGDLVIGQASESYQVGDVVAYRVPDGQIGDGHIIIHRIVGGDAAAFTLQGDNNDAIDPWTPRDADVIGRAWIVVPGVGRLLAMLHEPVMLGAFAAAIVVAVAISRPASPRRSKPSEPSPA
jgi:signal peptidase I